MSAPPDPPSASARKRLRIWEIPRDWLCSVAGTCLHPADVARIIRRGQIRYPEGTPDYEIHGFLVMQAGQAGWVGREINKALDERAAGAIRKFGPESDPDRLRALWDDFCGRGLVSQAYWALISHARVPHQLKLHAFGEVHMLSHFMGGFNRANAKELWLARRGLQEAQEKLTKARRQADATAEARDARIAALERDLQDTRMALASAFQHRAGGRTQNGFNRATARDRSERRIAAARARARTLEHENARLRALLDLLTQIGAPTSAEPVADPPPPGDALAHQQTGDRGARCVLYVGGRCQLLPHLRAKAEACNTRFLHHDGGEKETLHALGPLVERADLVVCPIDCVSHQACLKAKSLCRRQVKPFIPLRSSSATSFARAITALQAAGGTPEGPQGREGA